MKLLLLLIPLLAIPVLGESSEVEFPTFKSLTQEEYKKCESLSYRELWQRDTLRAVRYTLQRARNRDTARVHYDYIRWAVTTFGDEHQAIRNSLARYLKHTSYGDFDPKRIINAFNYNLWLLLNLYEAPQTAEIKRSIQYTRWIMQPQLKNDNVPSVDLGSPESIELFLGDRAVEHFLIGENSGRFQFYDTYVIHDIEKQYLQRAVAVTPDNPMYQLLLLFYSSIPNRATSHRSYTVHGMFSHLKNMTAEERSKALTFKEQPEFQSPFWQWHMGYLHFLDGDSLEAFETMKNHMDSTVLSLPQMYSRTYGGLLETHGTENDMLHYARMSSVKRYCIPRYGVKSQEYLYPIALKHGDSLIIAQCESEKQKVIAKRLAYEKKRKRDRVRPLIMLQGDYASLSGFSGGLYWGWSIRGADWVPTMKFTGGQRAATAGAGIITNGSGLIPGYLAATVEYVRSYGESSFHEKYEYEANRNGILCNAEFGVMFGAVEFGVAAFPKMEDPVHFNFGISFWFPLAGM